MHGSGGMKKKSNGKSSVPASLSESDICFWKCAVEMIGEEEAIASGFSFLSRIVFFVKFGSRIGPLGFWTIAH